MARTGSVPAILKKAVWIWPDGNVWDLYNCYALFRKAFRLKTVPKKARLFITADQSYQFHINGRYVCRGPARGFQSHWPFDEVDVASFLRRGKNVIAVRAYNPGVGNFQYVSQGYAGLLVGAKWGKTEIVTDRTWKCIRQEAVSRDTVPSSYQLFPQEFFDARKEPANWKAVGFDDRVWRGPTGTNEWNSPPWADLEPRMIPMLDEKTISPAKLIGECAGACAPGYLATRNVVATRQLEKLKHMKPDSTRIPVVVPPSGKGRFRSYVLDFGRIVVGNLELKVSGCRGGEIIDTMHVEVVDEATLTPAIKFPAGCRAAFGYRLTCRKGTTRHTFHHYYGFRYLVLTVRDSMSRLNISPRLHWVGYPLEVRGRLVSSDAVLEKIWKASAWTQQCCSLDSYVDTPWREQAQWWGDARVQAANTFHISGDARLLYRGIHCIASQLTSDGLTYGHAPTIAHNCVLPDFSLIWILTLWDHYWQTGSLEAFEEYGEVVESVLGYFAGKTDAKTGLVPHDKRYWLFLDWANLFKDGYSALYNLWLLLTLQKTVLMYRLASDGKRAAAVERWAARVRRALRRLVGRNGLVRDGLTWKRTPVRTASIHTQVIALATKLSPSTENAMLRSLLLPYVRDEKVPRVEPSAYWVTYLLTELAGRGYGEEVVRFIRKRWLPMAEFGTTWENWDPEPGIVSRSHAWSAHPVYHLMQTIGGIVQTAPAWKEILFRPVLVGDEGGAAIPTPQGKMTSHWKRRKGQIAVRLSLPDGVCARVQLPDHKTQVVKGKRNWQVP